MTCITIDRPQMRWRGFGRAERMREPSPAARTMADTPMGVFYRTVSRMWFRGEDSNPYTRHQKPLSYH